MAFVYWIKHKDHTDMFSEGYIGVTTKSVERRYRKHLESVNLGSEFTVHNAIRKYGEDIVVQTLLEASDEYCYDIENKLRPLGSIGWNIAVGGVSAGMLGRTHSEATRQKLSKAQTGKKLSDATRKKMSDRMKGNRYNDGRPGPSEGQLRGLEIGRKMSTYSAPKWENPYANKDIWKQALDIFKVYEEEPCGSWFLAKKVNIKPDSLKVMTKLFESGWNPLEDTKYLDWLNSQQESVNGY